jgi:UDP-N-acetylglucosamine 2-epimerase (non-hydrolysing)
MFDMRKTTYSLRVVAVMGTRPEAIKLAPVLLAARKHSRLDTRLISTGQHREVHDQVLELFGLAADVRVDVMEHGQSLARLSARCLVDLEEALLECQPDVVLVQGDTTSAAMAGLAAFYAHIPVWHVEAGLRTSTPDMPFPEEMNRRLLARLASFNLAPTETARENLLREGVPADALAVTGNTGIDALYAALRLRPQFKDPALEDAAAQAGPILVVTSHRRENWGAGIRNVAAASRSLLEAFADLRVIHAAHPNPSIRADVDAELADHRRALIVDPVDYGDFVRLLARATVIVTDSGGIQEEAPSLGVPVIVTRVETERVESVQAGVSCVVGADRAAIVDEVSRLLRDPAALERKPLVENPYGDGKAAERIVDLLTGRFPAGAQRSGRAATFAEAGDAAFSIS